MSVYRFGVDNVQTGQAWIAHRNKSQWHGGCRFCSGNRLWLSSHSKYKFLKNVQTFMNFLYIYIHIYIYIFVLNTKHSSQSLMKLEYFDRF